MTRINTNFRADTTQIPPEPPPAGSAETAQLQAEIQAALIQIQEYREENGEFLNDENLRNLGLIETMLKAESSAMAARNINGATGPGAPGATDGEWARPRDLQDGWNGVPNSSITSNEDDRVRLAGRNGYFGEYMGTVVIPVNPVDPTKVAFKMSDDMKALYADSFGRDIVFTAYYNRDINGDGAVDESDARSWVVKDGVMRNEPIIISAIGLSHAVTIDVSKVYRVSGGQPGEAQGFFIWGTEFADTIKGSMVRDGIAGLAGNDTISGMAGVDTIYGDEYYERAGQFDQSYGGSDTINGGADNDIIYGGGGTEDTTVGADRGDTVNEVELPGVAQNITLPDAEDVVGTRDGWNEPAVEDGMYVIRHDEGEPRGGELTIKMPDGFTMAYAERVAQSDSLIITFVNDTGSFKVKIEGFFSPYGNGTRIDSQNVKLNFRGSHSSDIIDFSRVTTSSQIINIYGNDGDDMILGPLNQAFSDGIDLNNMLHGQGVGNLGSIVSQGIFAPSEDIPYEGDSHTRWNGMNAAVENGQVRITGDAAEDVLRINLPDGFDKAYAAETDGNLYVILVKPATAVSPASTIVLSIANSTGIALGDILFFRESQTDDETGWDAAPIEIIPLGGDFTNDYLLDGGDGSDFYVAQEGANTRVNTEEGDEEVPMENTAPSGNGGATGGTGSGTGGAGGEGGAGGGTA